METSYFIEYSTCLYGEKTIRKYFSTYDKALEWAQKNLFNFNYAIYKSVITPAI